ncbi:MAG: WbqC family protein [Deltaproteobacteria bacterium]|nr:WbqC family protein [Deltaproteobacteria bacterium]
MRRPAHGRAVACALPAFWPSLGTLTVAAGCGRLALRDDLPFEPGAGLHCACLPSTAGQTWITLPVRSALPGTPTREITLAPTREWAARAMRAIENAFAETAYFEHYRCDIARLLFGDFERLVDLDLAMLRFLLRSFGVSGEVLRASECAGGAQLARVTALHGAVASRPAIEALLERGPGARALLAPGRSAGRRRRGARPSQQRNLDRGAWFNGACGDR